MDAIFVVNDITVIGDISVIVYHCYIPTIDLPHLNPDLPTKHHLEEKISPRQRTVSVLR